MCDWLSVPVHDIISFVWCGHLFQNCRSKKCVVCVSRIDSIVIKIDLIEKKTRLDWNKNRLDLCHVQLNCWHNWHGPQNNDSMQNYQLDCVPRSTQCLLILPCSSQFFNNRVDSLTIESILQQSSRSMSYIYGRSFNNLVDPCHISMVNPSTVGSICSHKLGM